MSNLVLDESSMNREASRGYSWWFSGDAFERQAAQDRRPPRRKRACRLRANSCGFAALNRASSQFLLHGQIAARR